MWLSLEWWCYIHSVKNYNAYMVGNYHDISSHVASLQKWCYNQWQSNTAYHLVQNMVYILYTSPSSSLTVIEILYTGPGLKPSLEFPSPRIISAMNFSSHSSTSSSIIERFRLAVVELVGNEIKCGPQSKSSMPAVQMKTTLLLK